MKIVFEDIKRLAGSSFRILVNPKLNNFYYWHFHPEFELTFIVAPNGTRRVGDHIGDFEGSDLVFIGSNIPHLNFDYGIKTEYEKVVLQIKEDFFKNDFITTPELAFINQLFENSKKVVCFHGAVKDEIGKRLQKIHLLSHFEQFIEVLSIFQILATANEKTLLHDKPFENLYNNKEQVRLKVVYKFIEENYQRAVSIEEISRLTHLSKAAFCRYFKKMTRLTFTEFLNQYRIEQAKILLKTDKNATETCFECGFESLSYFNRIFKKVVGENPIQFKKR
ncbi:AraC family transcriptional regulator [Flavobacterium sp. GSP27]|uniref:AraC family transcriptional regulator n=1 Tax=unclassified Flavobacterium TaxID=196869 RepID=UPI000F81A19F|nr:MULTISPECIES: AraC family transcriptional regulator [unclassified Flavobacterium]RTY96664.1 AraC family transcriptional regulator [Flavobacterium sp. GSN2]RTY69574.1 AraC family transcriptional regulator [Flavobacterium sp. LB2P53]RTY75218.1 AraC family transcriptional regulator [Flavobacterium sp. LS1R10]RTY84465.1 AraC family transcriptional regulator [Flavobacterium sp. ZB4P23]RTY92169.1 AraC family transcriptional regulator [Flavobacterium sp. RSP46]